MRGFQRQRQRMQGCKSGQRVSHHQGRGDDLGQIASSPPVKHSAMATHDACSACVGRQIRLRSAGRCMPMRDSGEHKLSVSVVRHERRRASRTDDRCSVRTRRSARVALGDHLEDLTAKCHAARDAGDRWRHDAISRRHAAHRVSPSRCVLPADCLRFWPDRHRDPDDGLRADRICSPAYVDAGVEKPRILARLHYVIVVMFVWPVLAMVALGLADAISEFANAICSGSHAASAS